MKRKGRHPVDGRRRIKANPSKQAPNNSYSPPKFYEDIHFKCRGCGVECVWKAEQQRLWYEEWGGRCNPRRFDAGTVVNA